MTDPVHETWSTQGVHGPGILVLSSSKKQLLPIFRSWTALLPSFNTNCVRENAVLIDQWEKFEVLCIYLWTHGHLDVDDNTLAPQKIFRGKWSHLQALHKAGSPKIWIEQSGFKRGNFTVLRNIRYLDNILLDINARKGIDFETEDGIKYSHRKSDSKFLEPFQIVKVKNMKQFVPSKSF